MTRSYDTSPERLESYLRQILFDGGAACLKERAIRARVQAIIDLHSGSDSMIDILDTIGDKTLLRRYLDKSLPHLRHSECNARLTRSIAERDTEFISLLVRYGVRIAHLSNCLITSALAAQDADFMAFLRAALDDSFFIMREVGSTRAIDECTRSIAPFIAEELSVITDAALVASLMRGGKDVLSLKVTATLVCLKTDMKLVPPTIIHPLLRRITATGGQRQGHARASTIKDLQDVLRRDVRDEFLGHREIITQEARRVIKASR